MEYDGPSKQCYIKIKASAFGVWGQRYKGQYCAAIVYPDGHAQIDSEQLIPPLPKWQSLRAGDFEEVERAEKTKEGK